MGSAFNLEFYKNEATGRLEPTDATTAMAAGAGKMVVGLYLLPDSTSSVTLWVQAELTAKVGQGKLQSEGILFVAKIGNARGPNDC